MPRTACVALSLVIWTTLAAVRAGASDLSLGWRAPLAGCPDREQLVAGIAQRVQREIRVAADAELRIDGQITLDAAGYVLALRIRTHGDDERRVLHARSCNELIRATVLIAALSLGPELAASDATVADRALPPLRLYARAQLVADFGALPPPTMGASGWLGLRVGPGLLELGATAFLPHSATVEQRPGAAASLQLMAAASNACWALLERPLLAPCLNLELGSLRASADAPAGTRSASALWLAVGASARLGVVLTAALQWTTELAIGLPWDRTLIGIRELGPVHQVPVAFARVTSGVQGTLF